MKLTSSGQIKVGAIFSYLSMGVNMVSGLIFTPWIIHSIGKENYAIYTLALSVITLFVFDFGLSITVQRFLAKYLARKNLKMADSLVSVILRLYLLLDIFIISALTTIYIFIPEIYKELSIDELANFKIVFIISSIFSIISFPCIPFNGILNAHEKFVQLKICDVIHKLIIVALMSVCLLLGYGLIALVTVNAIAGVSIIIIKYIFIHKYTYVSPNIRFFNKRFIRPLLFFSLWVTVIAISQRLIFNIAPTILGICSGAGAIAIMGIVITLEGYVYSFSSAINGLFLPRVTQIIHNKPHELMPLMIRVARVQIVICGFIIIGFIILGHSFIELWIGNSYILAYTGAIIVSVPSFLQLPQEIADQALIARNFVKEKAKAFVCMSVINIILCFILAPKFGSIGVCAAIGISYIIRTIILDIIFYRKLDLNIILFLKKSYFKLLPSLILTMIISFVMVSFISFNFLSGWLNFLIQGIFYFLIFALCVSCFGLNKEEKALFLFPLKKIVGNTTK